MPADTTMGPQQPQGAQPISSAAFLPPPQVDGPKTSSVLFETSPKLPPLRALSVLQLHRAAHQTHAHAFNSGPKEALIY